LVSEELIILEYCSKKVVGLWWHSSVCVVTRVRALRSSNGLCFWQLQNILFSLQPADPSEWTPLDLCWG